MTRHYRLMLLSALLLLAGLSGCAGTRPTPFFAMDTAIHDLGSLDTVRALGYDGISWKTGPSADVLAAVEAVQRHGLSLFAAYSYQYALLTKTGLELDPYLDSTMQALKGSDALIWLPINSEVFPASSPDGDSVAVPALQQLADRAAGSGLRIAIYPHMQCWTERVQDAIRLAKKVGRPNFGVTFNLCHSLMAGDEAKIPELLTEAAPYLFMVTINGADSAAAGTSWSRLIRPLDEGSYDVRGLLDQLRKLGYSGPIGLQGYGVQIPVKENLARSIAAWRRLTERR